MSNATTSYQHISSVIRKSKKGATSMLLPKASRDEDEQDEEDEFGLMVKSSVPGQEGQEIANGRMARQSSHVGQENVSLLADDKEFEKVWKRVSDPRGLPEQDASVFVKARKTLKEDIVHNKDLMHKMTKRQFDDRLFIINEKDSGHTTGEEFALNQAIGTNKYTNPMVAKIAEYVAPGLEGLKVGLSVFRVGFNLFMWRDPFLTSIFFFCTVVILCVLLVFPWRKFFFVMGLGAFGPQNWVIRVMGWMPKKKKKPAGGDASQKTGKSKKNPKKSKRSSTGNFLFHNHLATDAGRDTREHKSIKSDKVHRALVPNSPLMSRRFYDWPPNPSLSKVEIHSTE